MRLRISLTAVLLALAALGACAFQPASQPGSSGLPVISAQAASDEEAIRQLIAAEGEGIVSQDVLGLVALWSPDAMIVDAKNTPDVPDDDARWRGRDAVGDRYMFLVFPGNPQRAGEGALEVSVNGDRASATGTTAIGAEVSPGGDAWTFVRRDGRWWISSLTYNLEPLP